MLEGFLVWFLDGMRHFWQNLGPWLGTHGVNIVLIVLIASFIKHFGARLFTQVISHTLRADLFPTKIDRDKRLRTLNGLVEASLRLSVWLIATLLIISEIKPTYAGPIFASAGVFGVALGFGAQSLIKDFTSGIFIIIENQYRVGDVIELIGIGLNNGVSGTVEAISIRTTVLRDLSGHIHHIPNGTVTASTNKTMDYGRLNEDVTVSNDTDVDKLEKIINEVGYEIGKNIRFKKHILETPHMLGVKGFTPAGLEVKIVGKTSASHQWEIRGEFLRALKKAFEKNEISLPGGANTLSSIKK